MWAHHTKFQSERKWFLCHLLFCIKDPAFSNPSYGTLTRYKPSEPDGEGATSNGDTVFTNEAVYETMPDNQDELIQSVKDHYETDYDVVLQCVQLLQ